MNNMSENEIRICCLILNYNDSNTVVKLVESIKGYRSLNYILIVDNCSTDGSYEFISNKYRTNRNIICVKSEKNGGYGYGNNFGIKYAQENLGCKLVLLSNPDVIFSEECITNLIDFSKTVEKFGIIAPIQLDRNRKIIRDYAWKIPSVFSYTMTVLYLMQYMFSTSYPKKLIKTSDALEVDCVPGSLLLINADAFLEVGGYDERMFLFCEENTIGFKLKQSGYKSYVCTKYSYIHMHGVSIEKSITKKRKRNDLLLTNRFLFMKDYLKASKIQLGFARFIYWLSDKEMIARILIKGN